MKKIALIMAFLLWTLSACTSGTTSGSDTTATPPTSSSVTVAPTLSSATVDPTTSPTSTAPRITEPTAKSSIEPTTTSPTSDPISDESIKVQNTPVSLLERPAFSPTDQVREEELVSLHGYSIGMTFAETQQVWEIPKNMVDYAIDGWTPEAPTLCIYVGNMYYVFNHGADADVDDFSNYILQDIYYGQTIYCTNSEPLCVLRDIELGDTIEDVLKSLPGNRTPQKWAKDQLYGEYGKPNSASLEYTTDLGFYELRIYCESCWMQLSFGSSGKLVTAEVFPI